MITTLTTDEAILQAVRDEPDVDLHRLAYADWLEENGDDPVRAEFIRVQVELWPLRDAQCKGFSWHSPGCSDRGRCNAAMRLRERERGLIGPLWREDWRTLWPQASYALGSLRSGELLSHLAVYRRGFVSEVRLLLAAWQQHGPALVRQHPLARVELSDRRPAEFSDTPAVWFRDMSDQPDWTTHAGLPDERIPGNIFDLMDGVQGGIYFVIGKVGDKRYGSVPLALDALSDAALRWARAEADPRE